MTHPRKTRLRILSTVVAALLLTAVFAGCSGNQDTANTTATAPATAPATAAPTTTQAAAPTDSGEWQYAMGGPICEEPVTITVLTHSGWATTLAVPNPELPVYAAIAERLGITIDWQIIESSTYGEMVNVRLMSSDLPDMVVMTDLNIASQLVGDDFFYSYDELGLEQNAPYVTQLFQDPDYAKFETTYRSLFGDDQIYGFGCTVIQRFLGLNLMVNNLWLDNLELKQPTTIDEFLNMLRAFRDEDANGNGDANDEIPLSDAGGLENFLGNALNLYSYYGWDLNEEGKVEYEYVRPEYYEYLKIRKTLFDEDLIDKEATRDMNSRYELVASDLVGAIPYWCTFQATINSKSPYYEDTESCIFQEIFPLVNKYTGTIQRYSRPTTGVGEGMYILKGSDYPEVCLRMADWLWASEEYKILMNFGIEGDSFAYDADGKPYYTPPEDWNDTPSNYVTSLGGGQPPFAHMQWEEAWHVKYANYMVERAMEIQPYYIDGMPPLVFNAQENEEINKYITDINTYRSEMQANFIEGRTELTEEEFDQYVEQLYSMGLTEVTAVYQNKYDAVYGG